MIETRFYSSLFTRSSLCLLALLLIAAPVMAQNDRWVRIHVDERDSLTDQLSRSAELADYGGLLFGQIDEATASELRARGHRVEALDNPFLLTLGEEIFDPLERATTLTDREVEPDGDLHLIQFKGPIRPQWLQRLRDLGVEVVQPLHPFSYFVWANQTQLEAAQRDRDVRWVGPMEAAWKVQPHQRIFSAEARPTMLMASAHGDLHGRIAKLRQFGQVTIVRPFGDHFMLVQIDDLPGDRYLELARMPGIFSVQYIPPDAGPRGEMSNQSIVGNIDVSGNVFPGYADWLNSTGYDGSGITVGVVDGLVRSSHVDLADRMVPCAGMNDSCSGGSTSAHGTHVAGAIAGTGATGAVLNLGTVEDPIEFLRGQGVAPGASIVTQRYQPFIGAGPGGMVADGMLQIYEDSARSGALLTNNSWGPTTTPQGYDIPTRQIDVISRDADEDTPGDQPVLAVWSIMNGGGDSGGVCSPSSLASPDEAKNLFAVGSTALQSGSTGAQLSNIFRISTNSAHGNACDGRRRPDIVAPGCSTDSTTNSSDTSHSTSFCGTSMASPVVSGSIAIFAEKYIADQGQTPSPALVKAVFTAAAQDLQGNPNADGGTMGHRPDRFQGYGRVDLDAVMNHGVEVYMSDQETVFTSTGDSWSVGLNAVDPSQPIRIMLAWTDAPGAGLAGTTPAWVNNLDLAVVANGSTYLGNVIGPDGWSATGGSADDRNNLEGVFLDPAQHGGAVEITVDATDIAGDALNPWSPGAPSQDFALVCYNCIIGDPTFTLSISGGPLQACIPDSGSNDYPLNVNVGTIGPYTGTIDLSSSTLPSDVSEIFNPTSVIAPGGSTWTLSVASTAVELETSVDVNGDDGINIRTATLDIDLDTTLETAPALIAPAEGATDISLQPALSWSPIEGINSYQVVLFETGIPEALIDETVTDTSYIIPIELATGTEYNWYVNGINNCGDGELAPTRSFTTRLEPIAGFSANELNLSVAADSSDTASLEVSNNGTGNLTWSVASDQLTGLSDRGTIDPALNEALELGSFSVDGDASGGNVVELTIPGGVLTLGTVLGFEFEGSVSGISDQDDWASDLRLIITSPSGDSYDVGGFDGVINSWDFQGSSSSGDGVYTSSHPVAFEPGTGDSGDWTLRFQHGWVDTGAGVMNWSDVTITLLKAPPPFCTEPLDPVPWLSLNPSSGSIAEAGSESLSVDIDTSGMALGDYTGYLCFSTNDPNAERVPIPVNLTVIENTEAIFDDRFEN